MAAVAAVPRTGTYSGVIFYNEACIFALAAAAAANDVGELAGGASARSSNNTPHARSLPWPKRGAGLLS